MFCNKCGKEISDQAKFCNYCGTPVTPVTPQPQTAAPETKPAPEKKKGSAGKRIMTIVVALVVYFAVRAITENVLTSRNTSSTKSSSSYSSTSYSANGNLTEGCLYGALYQNNDLTYGQARVHAPGYSLLPGDGSTRDYLCTSDRSTLLYTTKKYEVGISYDATDKDSILNSYQNSGITDMKMVDFRKYEKDGYPVVRYIMSGKVNGTEEYIGELIVLPEKKPTETLRFCMETLASNSYKGINEIFDSLDISSSYVLKNADTQNMGIDRINAK